MLKIMIEARWCFFVEPALLEFTSLAELPPGMQSLPSSIGVFRCSTSGTSSTEICYNCNHIFSYCTINCYYKHPLAGPCCIRLNELSSVAHLRTCMLLVGLCSVTIRRLLNNITDMDGQLH